MWTNNAIWEMFITLITKIWIYDCWITYSSEKVECFFWFFCHVSRKWEHVVSAIPRAVDTTVFQLKQGKKKSFNINK